jgi:hypothetical protein
MLSALLAAHAVWLLLLYNQGIKFSFCFTLHKQIALCVHTTQTDCLVWAPESESFCDRVDC